eukprot:gene11166-13004_t
MGVFSLLRDHWWPELANVAGFVVAFGLSFVGHRWLSFAGSATTLGQSFRRFALTALAGFACNEAAFVLFYRLLNWPSLLALFLAMVIAAGQTFVFSRFWAFRRSDVLAPGLNSPSGSGNIDITAKTVDIKEARETGSQSTEQKFKQSGLTLAITSPVISALQTANNQLQAAGNTSSGRMQALAAANAGFNLKQGADAVQAGQGDANGMVKNADGKMVEGNAADKAGGIGISLSLGASSSQSKQQSSADSAKGSKVNAGGNVSIQATRTAGAPNDTGKDSDITVQGSKVQAAKTVTLKADDQVNLLAAQNTTQESNSNQSKSGSIGLAMQLGNGGGGMGFTASASKATGQGAGNSTTYTNSQVAGNTVNIESGGDTNLKGAVVKGDQVTAKVGGNLTIQSLQDKSQYKESSKSAGGSVMVGAGVSGSVNLAKSSINSDYLSVGEQSAIRAGEGGFQVNVQGKTTLTGGQITSTQAAIDNNKNSYEAKQGTTTTDLQNSANYSANSVSVGIGAGTLPGKSASAGMSGVGVGSDKGSAQSTTTAGISGVAGNTAARTGDKGTSIAPIFNKDQVKDEVNAQVAITSEFGKQASKAVGDYAKTQYDKALASGDKAGMDAWKEGGSSRIAMHAVVGGLTGGVQGAVGAGTSQAVIDQVGQALKETNLPAEVKQALVLAAGTAVGAAASGGSVTGGATAFNATANNYLTTVDLSKANRTKSLDIKTSLANNDKLINACQGGSSASCTQAQTKVQQDIQDLQDYKIALLSERNLSNDSATKDAISARIKEADAQIASANNQIETARLQTNGGNYFTKDLTGAQRETIGMALDPLQAAGVKAGVKVVNTVNTVIDNAVVSAEQATSVNKTKVELNGVSENVAAKSPTATDATATSPYGSNGTIYGKTTLTDVNGNPIATKPTLPGAEASGGGKVVGEITPPVTSGGTANSATGPKLAEQLSNESLVASGANMNNIKVVAEGKVNGQVYIDTNQGARPVAAANASEITLVPADRVAARDAQGLGNVNGNMATAHAEIGVIQQASNAGVAKGADMTLTVKGEPVCTYCRGDIPAAAEAAGLKSLTIVDQMAGITYFWKPGMTKLGKL